MTSDRKHIADQTIQRSLMRKHPDLSDNALAFLMDAAQSTLEYRSHIAGEALDVTGLVEAVKRSEAGQLIFAAREDEVSGQPDHVAATKDMTPQQRMNYARKHGLA